MAIESLAAVSQEAVIRVRQANTELIAKLQASQVRLLRLHAEEGDDISPDAFRSERARMQSEVWVAEQSLAETEQRLQFDADQLRMALELAGDVAAVYRSADEPTKRGYNQALYVLPEWDEAQGATSVRIASAELTEAYVALLADGLVEGVMNEVEMIRNAGSGSLEPLPDDSAGVSYFELLAEREGFEPSDEVSPVTRFPVAPVQPLRHLSVGGRTGRLRDAIVSR